jgi:hypothetical protein
MEPKPHVPGFAEIDEWPIKPEPPVSIADFGCYRDPSPHPTVYVVLTDVAGHKYEVFFEIRRSTSANAGGYGVGQACPLAE